MPQDCEATTAIIRTRHQPVRIIQAVREVVTKF